MCHLILVCTVIISVIAFTYLPMTGVMGATTNTTAKGNATPNTALHKTGVPKPSKGFLTPYYKGMAYLKAGNYTEAIAYFDKALAINPKYVGSLDGKGVALLNLGKYNESIAYFDKALAINPKYVGSLDGKGVALLNLGKYNESIAYFDKALAINPNYLFSLYNKGAALSKLGKYNESIAYFDKVLAINPTSPHALAGKESDLAALSNINAGTTTAPQNPSTFGFYFGSRPTNGTGTPATNALGLNCDLPGHQTCYSSGYSAGLVNKGVSCSSTLIKGSPTQVNNYCSGYNAAQQQQLQQQK